MKTRSLINTALVAASIAACAPAAPPPPKAPDAAAIRAELEKTLATTMAEFTKKNLAGALPVFAPDAVWILPDATTFTGTAAIEAGAKAFLDMVESSSLESVTIDRLIVVSDSEAVTFSHAISTMQTKGQKKAERHNNPFADHWKKGADGVWRVAYEVNADGVVPEKK